ncbi:hypothetical protein ACWGF3_13385 [Streptomyces xanthophaeus]
MNICPKSDDYAALAYPEPAAHPNWHRHGRPALAPLTPDRQHRNQELLLLALRTHRPHTHRNLAEAN